MTNHPKKKHSQGFTLAELLVSVTLLLLMGLLLTTLLTQAQKTWLQSGKRIEAYREARVAFESISRDLSQATLHPYWDYDQPNSPQDYVRRSELRFISGPELVGTSRGSTKKRGITHSVFFQAPLGRTSNSQYQGLETMFNSCGFFIEYGDDTDYRPDFLADSVEVRTRFKLMQWVQPAENWDLFSKTSGKPEYKDRDWYNSQTAGDTPTNIHVLAENVIALILQPRLSETEDPSGTRLAPNYLYDSAPTSWPPVTPQSETENQLPPFIQVTLVTLDEASASRLEELSEDPIQFLGLNDLFQDVVEFDDDLEALKELLQDNRLQYRVFQSAIQLQSR